MRFHDHAFQPHTVCPYRTVPQSGFSREVCGEPDNQQTLLEGQLSLLGKDYPLYIYFQPSKLENGNILLTVKDFSVGTFQIPQKMVLRLLSKNKNIPDFIQISPKESTITIVLPKIDNDFGIYVKANTIDLYNDKIVFDLYQKK